jgi:hypothetical protein
MNTKTLVEGKNIDFTRFEYITSDLEKFRLEFGKITSFLNREINEENFQLLVNSFTLLIHYVPLPAFFVNKNFLIRGRANYNGEVFKEEADISYNTKAVDRIVLGRFNRPFEAMFYGAVPYGRQIVTVTTVCIECCKEIEDENSKSGNHYFTFGKWHFNEPIPILNLCFNEKCLEANPDIKVNIEIFRKDLKENVSSDVKNFMENYWAFLTNLACVKCTTPQQHFISTAFISTLKEYFGDVFNGIIYPSSMTGMEGVNIVLTPAAVDRYLNLRQAFMFKLARKPNNFKSYNGYQASKIADVIDKKFAITGIL